MDGRSVWADPFEPVAALARAGAAETEVLVAPSTSLMFLPVTTEGEDLPDGFQFAREKAAAWRLGRRPRRGRAPSNAGSIGPRVPAGRRGEARATRRSGAPHRPTSTSPRSPPPPPGASPRPAEVRRFGCRLRRGDIDQRQYTAEIDRLIIDAVHWQEEAGSRRACPR